MAHEPIRPCVDDMVTGFLHHPVRPETAQVKARPPGEQKSGSRQRDQYPGHPIAKRPKVRLRVVLVARRKGKQQDQADVKDNAEKELGRYAVPLFCAVGPKHRNGPRHQPHPPQCVNRIFRRRRNSSSVLLLLPPLLTKAGLHLQLSSSAKSTHRRHDKPWTKTTASAPLPRGNLSIGTKRRIQFTRGLGCCCSTRGRRQRLETATGRRTRGSGPAG